MKITKEFLLAKPKYCDEQVEIFESHYPNGVDATMVNVVEAMGFGLNVEWFVENKLPASSWDEYKAKRATFLAEIIVEWANDSLLETAWQCDRGKEKS